MNESKTEYTKETEATQDSELNYKRAYLRLVNRVSDAIDADSTETLEEALLEAEDICIRDDTDED